MKKPFCIVSVGYMLKLNLLYWHSHHRMIFMGFRDGKVLDVSKIVGTQVKVERGDREIFI